MNESQIEEFILKRLDEWLPQTLTISAMSEEIDRRHRMSQKELSVQLTETQRLQSQSSELQSRFSSALHEVRKLKLKVDEINVNLNYRAYREEVKALELDVRSMCPLSLAESLQEEINGLAKSEELKSFIEKQNVLENTMYSTFFNQKSADKELSRMKTEIMLILNEYASKEELQTRFLGISKRNAEIGRDLEETKIKVLSNSQLFQDKINNLRLVIDRKASLTDLDEVYRKIQTLVTMDTLHAFISKYVPQINECQKEIENIQNTLGEHDSAMQRLDELILEKSSKIDLYEVSLRVEKISKHVDLEDKIDEMARSVYNYYKLGEDIREMYSTLKTDSNMMMGFYVKQMKDNQGLSSIHDDINNIQNLISEKIDRGEILALLDLKTNNTDLMNLAEELKEVSKNLKLTASQISAMQKVLADPLKAKGLEKLQREYLNKSLQKLIDVVVLGHRDTEMNLYLPESRKTEASFMVRSRTQTPVRAFTNDKIYK